MRNGGLTVLVAAASAAAALAAMSPRSWADGAVAVGSTGNVVRDGIAFGLVVDEPKETAAETAVKRCRTFQARAAAERCQVVATFSGECFAVAYDPKPGTPGAGWGIGPDQLAANRKAIAMCEESAGPARRGFCQVETGGCDTTGQREGPKPAGEETSPAAPPAKSGVNEAASDVKVVDKGESKDAAKPARPTVGMLEPAPMPRAKAPSAGEASPRGAGSPLLPVGAMAAVGLAYALGQYARGKLKGGLDEKQVLTGGAVAVASAVLVKLLDLAGAGEVVAMWVAGVVALAAAIVA